MKIMITGASGYIGQALCAQLLQQGHEVVALCRNTAGMAPQKNLHWKAVDITQAQNVLHAMEGCTQVYHTAAFARLSSRNIQQFYRVNVEGTKNVLNAAAYHHVEKLVYTSSGGSIGKSLLVPMTEDDVRLEPFNNHYDLSKHMAEKAVREYVANGNPAVIVNPTRVFGPGKDTYSNVLTRLMEKFIRQSYYLVPCDGEAMSNYAFIDDVVAGHLKAMELGVAGERYILGGANISYNQFYAMLSNITGLHRKKIQVPFPILLGAAHVQTAWRKLLQQEPELTPETARRICQHRMLSSAKAIQQLQYHITNTESAMRKTLASLGIDAPAHHSSMDMNPMKKFFTPTIQ
ncbi:MAG TPA: NAD-dependent epimerase/dehydratase family protein [Phnomibacter sp.]|nr:NAD-dependent epimerase/dehydratase family protein [Phnomibacter sp.]